MSTRAISPTLVAAGLLVAWPGAASAQSTDTTEQAPRGEPDTATADDPAQTSADAEAAPGGGSDATGEAAPPPPEPSASGGAAGPAPGGEAAPAPLPRGTRPSPRPAEGVPPPLAQTPSGGPPTLARVEPAPPTQRRTRPHWTPIITGAAMLAFGWIGTFTTTSIWFKEVSDCDRVWFNFHCRHEMGPDSDSLGFSFLPLVGPWLMLGSDTFRPAEFLFPVFAGLVQVGGLVTMIAGIATPQPVEPRSDEVARGPELSWDLAASPSAVGVTLRLTHF